MYRKGAGGDPDEHDPRGQLKQSSHMKACIPCPALGWCGSGDHGGICIPSQGKLASSSSVVPALWLSGTGHRCVACRVRKVRQAWNIRVNASAANEQPVKSVCILEIAKGNTGLQQPVQRCAALATKASNAASVSPYPGEKI